MLPGVPGWRIRGDGGNDGDPSGGAAVRRAGTGVSDCDE